MITKRLSDIIAPSFYKVHNCIKKDKYASYGLPGGRGSTKSSFIGIEIPLCMMRDAKNGIMSNAIAIRRHEKYCKDSVYEQLSWGLDMLGVGHLWHKGLSPLSLTYIPTGQKILFRGGDKPKKIKSTKFSKGYCKYLWFEEVDEFEGMEPIRVITQSLIRGGDNVITFYSFNPPKTSGNWANMEFKKNRPDRLVHHTTYLTVPPSWLGNQFIVEAEHLKATNELAYRHEYLGEEVGAGGEIFSNVTLKPISDEEIKQFYNIKRGLDFGYSIDPLSYTVCHYDRKYKKLYIFNELYAVGFSNRKAYEYIIEENKNNEIVVADSAEPKSINEISQYGLRIKAVKKGPDSIEFGIKFLQDLEEIIIDDERCPNTAREFLSYELEQDANGNWKAQFPDKDNHSIDAVRYALNDECMKFKEEKKKGKSDPENLTPQEKTEKAIQKVTGKYPSRSFFKY